MLGFKADFQQKPGHDMRSCQSEGRSLYLDAEKDPSLRKHANTAIFHGCKNDNFLKNKNSAEVDIAPAFGEITTACNVGQGKKGHGACLKSGQLVYARFHTHSHRCCREMYFNSRLDVNFLDLTQNIDKVSGA